MTLADDDTNPTLADNASIHVNVAIQVTQIVNQSNLCHLVAKFATKWRHLVTKFARNVCGAMLLPNLFQVMESISESVEPLAIFFGHLPSGRCKRYKNYKYCPM